MIHKKTIREETIKSIWNKKHSSIPSILLSVIILTSIATVLSPSFLQNNVSAGTFPGEKNGQIAFERNGGIYVMNADGSDQHDVTYSMHNSSNGDPSWSPDGAKIAFTSVKFTSDGSYSHSEIYVMNADGSDQQKIRNNTGFDFDPSWSPDGTKIAFTSTRDGHYQIYVMNADGSNQHNISNNTRDDGSPSWSPDGTKIAFTSGKNPYYPYGRGIHYDILYGGIYVMNADGSDQKRLTEDYPNSEDAFPSWSPDGTKIAYSSGEIDSVSEIYVINADGSDQHDLPGSHAWDLGPSWSPDGNEIAFFSQSPGHSNSGSHQIIVMNADGSDQREMTNNNFDFDDYSPDWGTHRNTRDTIPPIIKANVNGTIGNNEWYTSKVVHVSWDVSDEESNVTAKSNGCNPVDITSDTTGQTLTCQATSAGGNSTQSITIKKDSTPPTITSSQQGMNFTFNNDQQQSNIAPDFHCSDATSGIDSCATNVTKLETGAAVGLHSYTVTAKDKAGNTATKTITYIVLGWKIKGFEPPIKNNSTKNIAIAGKQIPLKWKVFDLRNGHEITSILTFKSLTWNKLSLSSSCNPNSNNATVTNNIEQYVNDGSSIGLRYEPSTGFIIDPWVPSAAGCYNLVLTTADGSSISALFKVVQQGEEGKGGDAHRIQQQEQVNEKAVLASILSIVDAATNN